MTTKNNMTPAELTSLVKPTVAATMGRGRVALLQAFGNGLVTVPATVEAALGSLAHCQQARAELLDVDPGVARNRYNADVVAALREGRELPSPDQVEDIERDARLHGIRRVAIEQANQACTNRLEAALGNGDAIVAQRIRPALMALYAEARKLLEQHGARLSGPAEPIVGASPAIGKAWTRLGIIASDVSTLRGVQFALTEETCGHDHESVFAIYRDDPRDGRIWGQGYGARHHTTSRSWPVGDTRAYLGWVLANRLDVWCPTGPQRDQRWSEMFKPTPALAALGGPGADIGRWA